METPPSVCVETCLERDGVLTVTGLPYRADDRLVVQIESVPADGGRRFPMRGRPYRHVDPFEPAIAPDDWDALR